MKEQQNRVQPKSAFYGPDHVVPLNTVLHGTGPSNFPTYSIPDNTDIRHQIPVGENGIYKIIPYAFFKGQPVYKKEAVASLLGCSVQTLKRMVIRGEIKARKCGKARFDVFFFEKDIEAYTNR